jgi:hypothetical protein
MSKTLLVIGVIIVVAVVGGLAYFTHRGTTPSNTAVAASADGYTLSLCQNGQCNVVNSLSLQCVNVSATTTSCGLLFSETAK